MSCGRRTRWNEQTVAGLIIAGIMIIGTAAIVVLLVPAIAATVQAYR